MMKLILLLLILLVILGVSILTYSSIGDFMFAGGSDSALTIIRTPRWVIIAILFVCIAWLAFCIWSPNLGIPQFFILIVLLLVWASSVRAVGLYPDSRVSVGWVFYITGVVDFREHNEDYDRHASHTQISYTLGGIIEITSHDHTAKIFVGPILQESVLKLLKERGYKVVGS